MTVWKCGHRECTASWSEHVVPHPCVSDEVERRTVTPTALCNIIVLGDYLLREAAG